MQGDDSKPICVCNLMTAFGGVLNLSRKTEESHLSKVGELFPKHSFKMCCQDCYHGVLACSIKSIAKYL